MTPTWKRSSRPRPTLRARSSTSRSCSACRNRPPTRTSGTSRQRCRRWPRRWSATSRRLQPAHAAYFQENAKTFEASLQPWYTALAEFSKRYPNTTVATTEPVARLHARSRRDQEPDPVQHAGGHHERHRPGPPGRDASRTVCSPGTRSRYSSTTSRSRSSAHRIVRRGREERGDSRGRACTRRCRPPAMTTSRGCSPRSRPWKRRSLNTSRPKSCELCARVGEREHPRGAGR